MDENIYTITLSNGLVLSGLRKYSHNFVSKTEVTEEMFENGLDKVVVDNGTNVSVYPDMTLIHVTKIDGEWYFELEHVYVPEEKTYTITFSDGTSISNLKMNGNNFISKNPTDIPPDIFDTIIDFVSISDGEYVEDHVNVEFTLTEKMNNECWFIISDVPNDVLEASKLRADVDFIAMMTDVEI